MSDAKRRGGRETARGEIGGEAVPIEPRAMIAPEPAEPTAAFVSAPENSPAAPPVAPPLDRPVRPAAESAARPLRADAAWAVWAEMQAALARGCTEIATEMTGITRSGIVAATDAATAMLGARTFAETVEINAALVRRGTDTLVESGARMSEICAKAMSEVSKPLLASFATPWSGGGATG